MIVYTVYIYIYIYIRIYTVYVYDYYNDLICIINDWKKNVYYVYSIFGWFKKTPFSEGYNEAIETTQSMDSSNFGYLQPGHWIPQPLPAHDVIYIYISTSSLNKLI